MKTLIKTLTLFVSLVVAGSVFAAGHGGHGALVNLGQQSSTDWTVDATQFGAMTADSSEFVFTLILSANGKADIDSVNAMRIWFGDQDSDSLVIKLTGRKTDDGKMKFHSHLPIESGDDYTQFTLEVDNGADEGDLLSFKTNT